MHRKQERLGGEQECAAQPLTAPILTPAAAGWPRPGSTAPGPAGAPATSSAPCAAFSRSWTAPTAPCTASTARASGRTTAGPATECPAPPSGKRGPGVRWARSLRAWVRCVCLHAHVSTCSLFSLGSRIGWAWCEWRTCHALCHHQAAGGARKENDFKTVLAFKMSL